MTARHRFAPSPGIHRASWDQYELDDGIELHIRKDGPWPRDTSRLGKALEKFLESL